MITPIENENENENKNKILINYFNSMYIDCINFSKNIVKNEDETQCDFIKKKINRLNHPPDNSKLRHHIIYAVAK
jgi:predicted DNA-binding helix-hairpin-helix protein